LEAGLFSDAEGGEDAVEDVIRGGGAGEGVEGFEGGVEVEEEHFVRDLLGDGLLRGSEGGLGLRDRFVMAEGGEHAALRAGGAGVDCLQDLLAQFGDSLASEGGDSRQVDGVRHGHSVRRWKGGSG
jgi:hypothetical protein